MSLVLLSELYIPVSVSLLAASFLAIVLSRALGVDRGVVRRVSQAVLVFLILYLLLVVYTYHSYYIERVFFYFGQLDYMSIVVVLAVLLTALLTVSSYPQDLGEYEMVVAVSLLGVLASLLVALALDFLSIIVAWALLSLSSYSVIALMKDRVSLDASLRYVIVGVLASQFLLLGLGLLSVFSLYSTRLPLTGTRLADINIVLGVSLLLVAIGFKLGSAPLHFWLPDVYGRASPYSVAAVAGFIKLGLVVLALRLVSYYSGYEPLFYMLVFFSVASMVVGGFTPLTQTDVQRIMSFSSITHMGFILAGLAVVSLAAPEALGAVFYLAVSGVAIHVLGYGLSKYGVFTILGYVKRVYGTTSLRGVAGAPLPWYARLGLTIHLANLIGVPPLPGFWGKLFILLSTTYRDPRLYVGGLPWLTVVGVVMSVVSVFYYLNILRAFYLEKTSSLQETTERPRDLYYPYIASVLLVLIGLLTPLVLVYTGALR